MPTIAEIWRDIGADDHSEYDAAYDGTSIDQHVIETWMVRYTDNTATSIDALGADIPQAGSFYTLSGAPWFKVIRVLPKRSTEAPNLWICQVEYERKIAIKPGDPWDIKISLSGSPFSQTTYQDEDGADIVNSAGQSFDPTVSRQFYDEKIEISYKSVTPPDLSDYYGKVNSDTVSFTISGITRNYTARQLKMVDGNLSTTLTIGDTDNTPVWDIRISFTARKDAYIDQILDQGMNEIRGGILTPIIALDTKQPVNSPARLDGTGVHLAVGGMPVFKPFKIEKETTLSPLFSSLGD